VRDVFVRVVRALLFLVDELLEDVAEDVGVDLVRVRAGPVVEVPLVGVEQVEDLSERVVADGDLVLRLDRVDGEDAAVDVRDVADERVDDLVVDLLAGGAEAVVEQRDEQVPVELVEVALAGQCLEPVEPRPQVVGVDGP